MFISYRRADAGALADELARSIRSVFGDRAVFIDTGDVPAGSRWAAVVDSGLDGMASLLCVMGEHWTGVEEGGRRIDSPKDWVRREVLTAIERGVPVLPVAADASHVPADLDLPEELQSILDVQALIFQGTDADVQSLIDWLTPHLVPAIRFIDALRVDLKSFMQAADAFRDRLGRPSLWLRRELDDEDKRAQDESDAHACRVRQPVVWDPNLIAAADSPEVAPRGRRKALELLQSVERRLTSLWVGLLGYSGLTIEIGKYPEGETAWAGENLLRFAAMRFSRELMAYGATVTPDIEPPFKDDARWEANLDRFFWAPEEVAQARVIHVSGIEDLPLSELSIYGPRSDVVRSYVDSDFGRLLPIKGGLYCQYLVPQLELLLAAHGRRDLVRYDGRAVIRKIVDLTGRDFEFRTNEYP